MTFQEVLSSHMHSLVKASAVQYVTSLSNALARIQVMAPKSSVMLFSISIKLKHVIQTNRMYTNSSWISYRRTRRSRSMAKMQAYLELTTVPEFNFFFLLLQSQVYVQIQMLFKDSPDLLSEFKDFLPDAVTANTRPSVSLLSRITSGKNRLGIQTNIVYIALIVPLQAP